MEDPQQSPVRYKKRLRENISREIEIAKLKNVRHAYQLALKIKLCLKINVGR